MISGAVVDVKYYASFRADGSFDRSTLDPRDGAVEVSAADLAKCFVGKIKMQDGLLVEVVLSE